MLAASALALLVATGERAVLAARAWMLTLFGFAAVWVPSRFATGTRVPPPEAALVLAAIGLSLRAGLTKGDPLDNAYGPPPVKVAGLNKPKQV